MASLMKLVLANDLAAMQAALAQGADPNQRGSDGRTPLIHAAIDNQLEVVRLLLDSGADIDVQDESGNSALHYAAQDYHVDMVSLLVGHGATLDIEDVHGNTPLWRAVFNSRGRGELITLLLRAGAKKSHQAWQDPHGPSQDHCQLQRRTVPELAELRGGKSVTLYSFMRGRRMVIEATGTRQEMAALERQMVELDPGPLNRDPWAGAQLP